MRRSSEAGLGGCHCWRLGRLVTFENWKWDGNQMSTKPMQYTLKIHIVSPSDVASYPVVRLLGGHHLLPQADVLHGGDDVHLTHSSWNPQFCAAIAQRLRSFGKSESCASIEQKLGLPLCTSSQPPPFLLNTFSSTSWTLKMQLGWFLMRNLQ